jgi:hypothetical protein
MRPGTNQTNAAVYTVPAGKKGIVVSAFVEVARSASSSVEGSFWIREDGKSPRYRRLFSASNSSIWEEKPYGGLVYPAKTDIGMVVTTCTANNTAVYGGFDIVLIPDD